MPKKPAKLNTTLRDRILKNTTLEDTTILTESIIFEEKDVVPTPVPMLNVALSGFIDGGLLPGILQIAGPSKHFKTLFALLLVASFLKKYPNGVVLFYDSEFGTNKNYFKIFGIPEDNIIHSPVAVVEDMTHDILTQINAIKKGEHVLVLVDSIGNLASLKELADAEAGENKVDMTRAKKIKAMFRMIMTKLILRGIPMVIVNHTYQSQDNPKNVRNITGGGTGPIYNSNDIWIVGRQQEKDGKVLEGFNFIINVEKSRTIKEKSKIPINVSFEEGISRWSGLLDLAIEAGIVDDSSQGWYGYNDKKYRLDEIENNGEIWNEMLPGLGPYIEKKYRLPDSFIIKEKQENADIQ